VKMSLLEVIGEVRRRRCIFINESDRDHLIRLIVKQASPNETVGVSPRPRWYSDSSAAAPLLLAHARDSPSLGWTYGAPRVHAESPNRGR
jgi:hypothetical protein